MPSFFPQPLGPDLPNFKTLLVKGDYHPSAPIHLSLSHLSGHSQTMIITPSRQKLIHALQEYNDDWIKQKSGLGNISDISSRIKLFYPPSPAHLGLLFSTFTLSNTSEDKNNAWLNPTTTLAIAPSLVILHEPSMYFLPEDNPESISPRPSWILSSYLSLITHALSFISRISRGSNSTSFVLFDSQLDRLKLPVFKQPTSPHRGGDADSSGPRTESVSIYVQKYFEWVAIADKEIEPISAQKTTSISIYRTDQPANPVKTWHWEYPRTTNE